MSNLFILFLFTVCCEIIGHRVATLFIGKIPHFLRGTTWLLGLGIVVFFYFLSHFFFPYSFPTIFYILLFLVIPSIRNYFKTKGPNTLVVFIKKNILPLIVILVMLPQVFVKASQPPYVWDEMAYHYISPYSLNFEKTWDMGSSLTQNLPRLLDTAYISLFSLTKTYSVARILQFSIFATFLISAHSFLKQKFGAILAIAYFLLTFFYGGNFILWSTFGYVDVGTMAFVMIGFFSFLDYLFERNMNSLQFSFAFLGMAVGVKYSALTQFIVILIISSYLVFKNRRKHSKILRNFLVTGGLFLILGGYWYIKNLMTTGNPIYPFLFGCRFNVCETLSLGYTLPFTISNILAIFSQIFNKSSFLPVMFIVSSALILILALRKIRLMVIIIFLFVAMEIILVRDISGFEARYFFHWQALAILVIVAPLSIFAKVDIFRLIRNRNRKRVRDAV